MPARLAKQRDRGIHTTLRRLQDDVVDGVQLKQRLKVGGGDRSAAEFLADAEHHINELLFHVL